MRETVALITPSMSPLSLPKGSGSTTDSPRDTWRDPTGGSTINAVCFGFVATAILISMFLFMALFEHFLRPSGEPTAGERIPRWRWRWGRGGGADLEGNNKLCLPTVEMPVYAKEVSVLMPGQDVPTYIAHPMPAEKVSFPSHDPINLNRPSSFSSNPNPT